MRLRVRFALWFALAALLPIAAAAVITRGVVARGYRDEYRGNRAAAEQTVKRDLANLQAQVSDTVVALGSHDHPFVGGLLRELVKGAGVLDDATERRIREQAAPVMHGLSLDVLLITGAGDIVLVAPHYRAAVGDVDAAPSRLAQMSNAQPFFAREKIMTGGSVDTVLVAEAATTARDGTFAVYVLAGRRVSDDLLTSVRRPGQVSARIIDAEAASTKPHGETVRVPLNGVDGRPVAWVEIAVSDGGLDAVLDRVTLVSAVLAALAVLLTTLLGALIARRITRDLDLLVVGAQAAARGDLDHRVSVRSSDEVGAVASAFNFMMEDLRSSKERLVIAERIAAWQEIARRLAHEIKNPLTPIQMAMDTLRKTWRTKHPSFDEILEESTKTVLEEADRLKHIVSEFSDFSRMPKPVIAGVDLNEVVTSSLSLYQGSATVSHQLAAGLPEIDADRAQLAQVLLNLVENARDAVTAKGDDGRVVVSTRAAADRLELIVDDNGAGVADDVKDKIFAPYFTTKHGRGGTGLGLAIVHRIVSDHGGRIAVSSATIGGARFVVELPLHQGDLLLRSRG